MYLQCHETQMRAVWSESLLSALWRIIRIEVGRGNILGGRLNIESYRGEKITKWGYSKLGSGYKGLVYRINNSGHLTLKAVGALDF